MKQDPIGNTILTLAGCLLCVSLYAQSKPDKEIFQKKYDLSRQHSKDPQYFIMQSRLVQFASDGTRKDSTIYTLYLKSRPAMQPAGADVYTCLRFTIRSGNGAEVSIPSLSNWEYIYGGTANTKDKEQLFGIDNSRFENLADSNGRTLSIEKTYHVYNAFIDFHTMFVFAEKSPEGKGVQDLKQIGDKIVHAAAFSEPPVNLGKQIKKGSVFRNGEITLEFKGVGLINDKTCAILGYDSGNSSFQMLMEPMTGMEVNTTGSSHYWGDIYKDLQTGWIQKASLQELVISETSIPGQSLKVHSVIERNIQIRNTTK